MPPKEAPPAGSGGPATHWPQTEQEDRIQALYTDLGKLFKKIQVGGNGLAWGPLRTGHASHRGPLRLPSAPSPGGAPHPPFTPSPPFPQLPPPHPNASAEEQQA
jgi:hypothetical protein